MTEREFELIARFSDAQGAPMRRLNLLLLAIATLFLFALFKELGWAKLSLHLRQMGRYWPLVLIPFGVVNLLDTLSWKFLLVTKDTRLPLSRLYCLRLAGESLNQLTPTASLGGEPFKALHLHNCGVPWQEATASLIIHKGLTVLSLVLYIFMSLALVPFVLPGNTAHLGILCLGALALAGGGVTFVIVQRCSPCVFGIRLLKRFGLCPAALRTKEEELATLDSYLARFYREHAGRGLLAFFFFFLGWMVQSVEVYLIFQALGYPVSWGIALCLDALAMLFTGLGFMIPASLGVQDGGNILLALGFNLGATLGGAFSIIRRFREAFWLFLGLLVAARQR